MVFLVNNYVDVIVSCASNVVYHTGRVTYRGRFFRKAAAVAAHTGSNRRPLPLTYHRCIGIVGIFPPANEWQIAFGRSSGSHARAFLCDFTGQEVDATGAEEIGERGRERAAATVSAEGARLEKIIGCCRRSGELTN